MEEKKNVEEIKEVKKGEKIQEVIKPVAKKALSSKYLKIFGFSLMFLGVLICILMALILLIKYYQMEEDGLINEESNIQPNITVTQEENVIINVVKKSSPSVVSVAVSQVALRRGEGLVDEVSNIGTGFIVDPNGIIVTNQHVVSDTSATYRIITSEGKEYEIVEIVRDDSNDIAILKVDATQLPALQLGDSDNLVVGQTVIAIGTPLGEYSGSVTTGVISGINRSVTASSGWFDSMIKTYENVLQTDAAINSGNSGGPLISTEGKVIGINFATTANADNISFALPINIVKQRLEEYRVYGKFIKPYIGISYQMISQYQALYYADVVAGALVMSIDPKGPASKVDIKRGDIIVKVNEQEVNEPFASIIQSYKVGDELTLEVWREGKTHTVKVPLAEAD